MPPLARRAVRGGPCRATAGLAVAAAALAILVALVALAAGCGASPGGRPGGGGGDPPPGAVAAPGTGSIVATPRELAAAASRITLGGRTHELRAELWRDFMPIAPPDGRPLVAVIELVPAMGGEAGSDPAPAASVDARIERTWVILGERAWTTDEVERRARATGGGLQFVVRGGPKWGPGELVDVAIRLRLGSGDARLLRSGGHRIGRTD